MRTIKTILFFALSLALAIPATAHKRHHHKMPDISPALASSLREMHAANKQWAQKHIVPTLLEWKQRFDSRLAAEDLAALNDLRTRAAELRAQKKELRDRIAAARKSGDEETAERIREELHGLFGKRRDLVGELMPVISEYREELEELREEARPTLDSWSRERRTRWAEWRTKAMTIAATDADREFLERMEDRFEHKRGHRYGRRAAVRFLLWDGVADPDETGDAEGHSDSTGGPHPGPFPNPADTHTSIEFSTREAGALTLTLYDAAGNVIATPVTRRHVEAGEHIFDISTQTLPSGSYRYSIEINGRVHTGTLQVLR